MKTKIIFLAGPPGSGKGTQAQLLKKRLGLEIIQVSQVVREKFKNEPNNPEVIQSKKAYYQGQLVDGELIAKWVTTKIEKLGEKNINKGLILDGAARTIEEARAVLKLLDKKIGKSKIKLFFIKISPQETLKRNLKRVVCQKCLKPIDPKLIGKIKRCPYCGGKLGKREMDNKKVIENRLKVYQKQTLPAINYLKKQGIVVEIDGEQPIEKVYQDIVKKLT